jgi:hypothetical protein
MNVSQQILSFSQQMDTNKTQKVKSNQGFEGFKRDYSVYTKP